MAKLVIGTNKQTVVPAVVRDKSPKMYIALDVVNGSLSYSKIDGKIDFTGVTTIPSTVLEDAFTENISVVGVVDMSSVIYINNTGMYNTFKQCLGITGVNLASLQEVKNDGMYMCFYGCSNLTGNLNLTSLIQTNAGSMNSAFAKTNITSADLSSLVFVVGNYSCAAIFNRCNNLSNVDLSTVSSISGSSAFKEAFIYCTSLSSLSFPSLCTVSGGSSIFNLMLNGCNGVTVHFPSNLQATIGNWSDVVNGFGGTNTTVLFDLVSSAPLTGANNTVYKRHAKFDTATSLAWWANYNYTTHYYTSGISAPQVGDTIYSDSACTQAVTTISSIA